MRWCAPVTETSQAVFISRSTLRVYHILHTTRVPGGQGFGRQGVTAMQGMDHLASLQAVSPPSTPVFMGRTLS